MNKTLAVAEIEGEVVESGSSLSLTEPMAVGLARAEIDVQIATARRYPRSISRASENILSLVTMDEDTAEECMFALPRGGKPIKGPSIRLAEIIFQCWGNARADARVVFVDRAEKVVVAEGIYHDLETNSASRATVRRSIVDRQGRLFKDDMITVTGNAACSIAKRNAILAGVPKSVWNRAYKAAEGVVAGNIATLSVSRDKAVKAFAAFGVKPEQIFPVLDVEGLDDIGLDHIPVLRGMFSAIKSGEATVEEMFSPRKGPSTHEKVVNPLSDKPPHDPDTGEVIAGQAATAGTPVEVSLDTLTEDSEPVTSRDRVLDELRAGIMDGKKLLTLLNALPEGDRALVTDEDRKSLKAVEKSIAQQQGGE